MRTITVDKALLVLTLQTNVHQHRATFEKATEAFREESIKWLTGQIEAVKGGKSPERFLPLPIPEEHTDDYLRVIDMLTWDVGDTVELTEQEFKSYVQDDWGWRQTWLANTTSYTGS